VSKSDLALIFALSRSDAMCVMRSSMARALSSLRMRKNSIVNIIFVSLSQQNVRRRINWPSWRDEDHNYPRIVSLRSRDLQRARSVSDMYCSVSSCWKKSKIRLIRAASSTACCRFRRYVLVRVQIEFANRSAASAFEDRIATRLSRSILTSEFRRASRSRTMFTCSRVPKNADFDLRPLYLMASTK